MLLSKKYNVPTLFTRNEFFDERFEERNNVLHEFQKEKLSRNCSIQEHLSFPKQEGEEI